VSDQPGSRPEGDGTTRDRFNQLADAATRALGSIQAVVLSVVVVLVWALSGPLFGFSDSWQLVINTSTTVITFWMVFVIQNSQGRDARAIHLKLDEIIRANAEARNEFIVAERATEAEVEAHERDLQRVVDEAPGTPTPAIGSDAH
jgi:low affinity Fe/Cu permease